MFNGSIHDWDKNPVIDVETSRFDSCGHFLSSIKRENGHRLHDMVFNYDSLGRFSGSVDTRYKAAGSSINCCDSNITHKYVTKSFYDGLGQVRTDSNFCWSSDTLIPTFVYIWDQVNRIYKNVSPNAGINLSSIEHIDKFGRRIKLEFENNGSYFKTTYDNNGLEKEDIFNDKDGKPLSITEYQYEYGLHAK